MNMRQPTNRPASIRQRLLNLSRDRGEDFNLTLTRYGTERLLYRLSQSERADHFQYITAPAAGRHLPE